MPIVGAQTVSDEAILRNMGDEALDVITTRWYSATIDTPANKKFVADYVKANGYEPGTFAAGGYSGGVFLEQGLIDAKGDIENKEQFMRHLRTMKITGDPRGPLRFDEYGNPIETMFITKVERVGGKLVNSVVATYPETSQFWTYDPKEFPVQAGLFPQLSARPLSGVSRQVGPQRSTAQRRRAICADRTRARVSARCGRVRCRRAVARCGA